MARIEYAKTADDAHIAYSVVGDGEIDVVYVPGYMISVDAWDDEPHLARMWRRFASFSRLIRFDVLGRNVRPDMRRRVEEISVPTLVLHASGNQFVPVDVGRYLAAHIPNAKYVEVASADNAMWGLDVDKYVDQIEEFVTGRRTSGAERVLATVLFSDIVASTEGAVALGNRAWRALLDAHDGTVRAELTRYGGREVNTTGDGFVAAFDSPTQAVACGRAIVGAAAGADVPVRVGVHTGECERRGDDLAGLAVHIAARVGALAAPGEVLVSRTVRDLVSGSGLRFSDRGTRELKGIPDAWQLFAVEP